MYVPAAFRQADLPTVHNFLREHSFALLCSPGPDGFPVASHLPLMFEPHGGPNGCLVGHMARANPQWRHADGSPVLAVFSGPHVYVSPSWYEADNVVPTWNYIAVHVTGTFRALHDRESLLAIVRASVAEYEGPRERPWRLVEGEYVEGMLRGIVGFRVEISGIEGKWKLSQNHPPERRALVVRALRAEGGASGNAVADLMEGR
jgi:transcriptional regulator